MQRNSTHSRVVNMPSSLCTKIFLLTVSSLPEQIIPIHLALSPTSLMSLFKGLFLSEIWPPYPVFCFIFLCSIFHHLAHDIYIYLCIMSLSSPLEYSVRKAELLFTVSLRTGSSTCQALNNCLLNELTNL